MKELARPRYINACEAACRQQGKDAVSFRTLENMHAHRKLLMRRMCWANEWTLELSIHYRNTSLSWCVLEYSGRVLILEYRGRRSV